MGKEANRIKYKSDMLLEDLSIRWITGDYRNYVSQLKSDKRISRRHPKIGKLYDFRYVNLKKTRLSDLEINDACFDNSKAYNSTITLCSFKNCDFNKVDFQMSRIKDVEFINCNLEDCDFKNSELYNLKVINCNLTNSDFKHSKLINLQITESILDGSDLSYLENSNYIDIAGKPRSVKGIIIDKVSFLRLRDCDFRSFILKEGLIKDDLHKEEYDVALSFAGENREYVEDVALHLKNKGIKVFYDNFEKANLWGKELVAYLTELYSNKAKYVIIFVSKHYIKKAWPNVERIATLSKILEGKYEFILPVMIDDTLIPGLTKSKGYLDGEKMSSKEIAECFYKKFIEDFNS